MFLRLDSAKECKEFRETKMRNSGRVLLEALNLYVRTNIRVATCDTNDYISTQSIYQSIAASSQKVPVSKGIQGQCVICFNTFNNSSLAPAKTLSNKS